MFTDHIQNDKSNLGLVKVRAATTTSKKKSIEYGLSGYEGLQSEFSSSLKTSSDTTGKFILCKVQFQYFIEDKFKELL